MKGFPIFARLLFLLLFCAFTSLFSQTDHGTEIPGEKEKKWRAATYIGYTLIPVAQHNGNREIFIAPTLGLDMAYKLSERWFIASVNEVELSSYVVNTEGIENLERDFAVITAFVVTWEPVRNWGVFWGAGMEWERHENFGVGKLGTEYLFAFSRDWDLGVSLSMDHKLGTTLRGMFSTYSLGVSIGRTF